MADVPTTAEVRAMLADEDSWAKFDRYSSDSIQDRASASARTLRKVALPIAEQRDALAAEIALLRADIVHFQRAASQAEQTRRDLVTERDALRPLAELGTLALAWAKALREWDDVAAISAAGATLVTAAGQMVEEGQ